MVGSNETRGETTARRAEVEGFEGWSGCEWMMVLTIDFMRTQSAISAIGGNEIPVQTIAW